MNELFPGLMEELDALVEQAGELKKRIESAEKTEKEEVTWTRIGDLEWSDNLGEMTWDEAVKKCAEVGGRLPKTWEMVKVAQENHDEIMELIEGDEFYYFWSASENSSTLAWGVALDIGSTGINAKTDAYQVRCVR